MFSRKNDQRITTGGNEITAKTMKEKNVQNKGLQTIRYFRAKSVKRNTKIDPRALKRTFNTLTSSARSGSALLISPYAKISNAELYLAELVGQAN